MFIEGTVLSHSATCDYGSTILFGSSQTNSLAIITLGNPEGQFPANEITMKVQAQPILLVGQTMLNESPGTSPTTARSEPSGKPASSASIVSTRAAVGAIIGSLIGAILLLGLGYFLFRRYRTRRMKEGRGGDARDLRVLREERNYDGVVKPELEGSYPNPTLFIKGELDANAIRAELEGHVHGELDGNEILAELE
ncbi:hypothetical protein F4819DRAFT_504608 [Hypoxylon fuscum]|nr:hypothetical protein F4819DRAFT_504608 [Hypoxylon fuscum]